MNRPMIRNESTDRGVRALAIALILLLAGPPLSRTQDSLIVHLKISDARGHAQTMRFGAHVQATLGFDKWLGEIPLPPYPPVPVFDVRFLHPDRRTLYAGDGSYADIRALTSPAQIDTFVVRLQAAEDAYPMRMVWDNSSLAGCDSSYLVDRSRTHGVFVDMKRMREFAVTDPDLSTFLIVVRGPRISTSVSKDH